MPRSKRSASKSDVSINDASSSSKVTLPLLNFKKKRDEGEDDDDDFVIPVPKKIKITENRKVSDYLSSSNLNSSVTCEFCRRVLDPDNPTIAVHLGDSQSAVEEIIMLTEPSLNMFHENGDSDINERPQHRLTDFTIYDQNSHLCSLDSGLIEDNVNLFVSGSVKSIIDDNPLPDGGILTTKIGPINEWFMFGYDGEMSNLLGISTAYCDYILVSPSSQYSPFLSTVLEKMCIGQVVLQYLEDDPTAEYEDLLDHIRDYKPPEGIRPFTEDTLLANAQFIVDQIQTFESGIEDGTAYFLLSSPCILDLLKMSNAVIGSKNKKFRAPRRAPRQSAIKKPTYSMATTTPLVAAVFEDLFEKQIAKLEGSKIKANRCKVCEACQKPDCGICKSCLDMVKFGGFGKSKQACVQRRCPVAAVEEAEKDADYDSSDDAEVPIKLAKSKMDQIKEFSNKNKAKLSWASVPLREEKKKVFYTAVNVGTEMIKPGDTVLVSPKKAQTAIYIALVTALWEENKVFMFHANWFNRSSETILGQVGDPLELFLSFECEDLKIDFILSKCTVNYDLPSPDWYIRGGRPLTKSPVENDDGKSFFCKQTWFATQCRMESLSSLFYCKFKPEKMKCLNCKKALDNEKFETPEAIFASPEESDSKRPKIEYVTWKSNTYNANDGVYLLPDAFKLNNCLDLDSETSIKKKKVDHDMYPEYYRKSETVKAINHDVPEPFRIGIIKEIFGVKNTQGETDIKLVLTKCYRTENTCLGEYKSKTADRNKLYWTNEEITVNFNLVQGKCYIAFIGNIKESIDEFTSKGDDRFYFKLEYDSKAKSFKSLPVHAYKIGEREKGSKNGKSSSKKIKVETNEKLERFPEHPKVIEKLATLDIFSGCGGLSEGLHQTGICESVWSIENMEPAAKAYKLNNPDTIVFMEDCNKLLKYIIEGRELDDTGKKLPKKGQVQMIVAGPPCQGFSGMNRFNKRQYSEFKNSLITTFLSYVEYFRPKYVIFENVRNFVAFKKSMVLKLLLSCLNKMGYQTTFGILQAGSYGVPQTRRRCFVFASAPGEILPLYPEPTHVFTKRMTTLSVTVDGKKYETNVTRQNSAPYRSVTVYDAMADLPEIQNGANAKSIPYGQPPLTYFQRMIRSKDLEANLKDHICKDMSSLVVERMKHIPTTPNSDWRELPNISVKLSNGTKTDLLFYSYTDFKTQDESDRPKRGVCSCAENKPCNPVDRQDNTLIPWCLPHTGNRHNHWSGLYGRLQWNGIFSTTVTNPEPMGKQGRVLHPEQHRVVSVRECARSQGFPDVFIFYGTVLEKHRQVGNAVPPPLAAAIGRSFAKAIAISEAEDSA